MSINQELYRSGEKLEHQLEWQYRGILCSAIGDAHRETVQFLFMIHNSGTLMYPVW